RGCERNRGRAESGPSETRPSRERPSRSAVRTARSGPAVVALGRATTLRGLAEQFALAECRVAEQRAMVGRKAVNAQGRDVFARGVADIGVPAVSRAASGERD